MFLMFEEGISVVSNLCYMHFRHFPDVSLENAYISATEIN
jgi:hypothetical protein